MSRTLGEIRSASQVTVGDEPSWLKVTDLTASVLSAAMVPARDFCGLARKNNTKTEATI
ncbi:MAG: hypothetical protein JO151_01105 [Verrucomicrobia bacterium]|nr:hypothetical protein [Verrucomicrobiota bacterium]